MLILESLEFQQNSNNNYLGTLDEADEIFTETAAGLEIFSNNLELFLEQTSASMLLKGGIYQEGSVGDFFKNAGKKIKDAAIAVYKWFVAQWNKFTSWVKSIFSKDKPAAESDIKDGVKAAKEETGKTPTVEATDAEADAMKGDEPLETSSKKLEALAAKSDKMSKEEVIEAVEEVKKEIEDQTSTTTKVPVTADGVKQPSTKIPVSIDLILKELKGYNANEDAKIKAAQDQLAKAKLIITVLMSIKLKSAKALAKALDVKNSIARKKYKDADRERRTIEVGNAS